MHGYSFEIRDAAFNTGAMSELLAKAISDKPDVLVVHNPTVQLLARQIKQAEAAGIKVLQINLQSNQPSAAFVGANWARIGTEIARGHRQGVRRRQRQIRQGGDHSRAAHRGRQRDDERGRVQGVRGAPGDQGRLQPGVGLGAREGATDHRTVLQQNPDLCAIFGHWDVHTMGAGKAVKDAGSQDKVIVYATGGGDDKTCKAVENKILTAVWSYDADGQGRDAGTMIDSCCRAPWSPNGSMLKVELPMKIIKAGPTYTVAVL